MQVHHNMTVGHSDPCLPSHHGATSCIYEEEADSSRLPPPSSLCGYNKGKRRGESILQQPHQSMCKNNHHHDSFKVNVLGSAGVHGHPEYPYYGGSLESQKNGSSFPLQEGKDNFVIVNPASSKPWPNAHRSASPNALATPVGQIPPPPLAGPRPTWQASHPIEASFLSFHALSIGFRRLPQSLASRIREEPAPNQPRPAWGRPEDYMEEEERGGRGRQQQQQQQQIMMNKTQEEQLYQEGPADYVPRVTTPSYMTAHNHHHHHHQQQQTAPKMEMHEQFLAWRTATGTHPHPPHQLYLPTFDGRHDEIGVIKHPERSLGAYSPEARKERLQRFWEKRKRRVWNRDGVRYAVRKDFAETRIRVKGRFVSKKEAEGLHVVMSVLSPHSAGSSGGSLPGSPLTVISTCNSEEGVVGGVGLPSIYYGLDQQQEQQEQSRKRTKKTSTTKTMAGGKGDHARERMAVANALTGLQFLQQQQVQQYQI